MDRVARYTGRDRSRLLANPGIVRNRLKLEAANHNARRIEERRATHGGFAAWLDAHHLRDLAGWSALFRRSFRFTGGQIFGDLLRGTGYLPGAHHTSCPVHARILELDPPWARSGGATA